MFTTIIVQPIFNLLVLIYALLPGHNFGLAVIIFTVVIRLLLWPLVKKQLHQATAMRRLQPELKKVKAAAKGDRQKESQMLMELYKEKGINPFGSIGILIVQLPILLGLYSGLRRVVEDPHQLISFAYPGLQHLPWMQELAHNIHRFDSSLFGLVDLTKSAVGSAAGIYWPAMVLVIGSAVIQYYQSKQLMPTTKDQRRLRDILKQAGTGQQADQSEVNAAVTRSTRFLIPAMIFLFTVNLASALSLYWFTGGLIAYLQQARILKRDEQEMEGIADKPGKTNAGEKAAAADKPAKKDVRKIPEGKVVITSNVPDKPSQTPSKSKKAKRRKKR